MMVIVAMIMMVVRRMIMRMLMSVRRRIGATLGIERRFDFRKTRAQAFQ